MTKAKTADPLVPFVPPADGWGICPGTVRTVGQAWAVAKSHNGDQ